MYDPEVVMHLALGTSLATIVLTSISSAMAHHKKQGIVWSVVRNLAPGMLLGSFFGAGIAALLCGNNLQLIIGVFVIWVAYRMHTHFHMLFLDGVYEVSAPHGNRPRFQWVREPTSAQLTQLADTTSRGQPNASTGPTGDIGGYVLAKWERKRGSRDFAPIYCKNLYSPRQTWSLEGRQFSILGR